ncbi:hypothetical protein ACFWIB_04360 [Streptomyces sp. NPDC127051]|uniref:hypothetical protein n=1 Tax=Streptomyces sp. NPDC127051 TaxID=3347119 RepID=UPI003651363B
MANDIEINVRVANNSNAGLSATTQSLNRLKAAAREANTQVARLRTEMSRDVVLRAQLDNQTEASFTQLRATIGELKAGGPIKIKARLDNQTEASFTQLKATIAELKGAGAIRLKVGLTNQTRAGLASIKADLRELKALSPVRLEARFNGDSAQITAAARAMRDVRSDTSRAGTALATLTPRAVAAAAALELVERAASGASEELRELRARASTSAAALQELRASSTGLSTSLRSVSRSSESAHTRMETLSTRANVLRDGLHDLGSAAGRAGGGLGGLRGSLGSVSGAANQAADSKNRLLMAAIALSPALLPIAASLAPVTLGMAAAAAASLAFGAAIAPQVKAMAEASKSYTKYRDAVKEGGAASAAAVKAEQAYLAQMAALSPATRQAAVGMTLLKEQYKGWHESLAGSTMPVATKSFALFGALFPKLSPVVQTASRELDRFVTIAAGGVQSPAFDHFMANFNVFAGETLARANSGLLRLMAALSSGKVKGNLAEFMQYARENGPLVGETLKNLAQAVGRLLAAASQTGVGLLSVVNAFAKLVNAIPPEVLDRLVQLAVTFKAVQLASAGMALVAPRLAAASAAAAAFTRSAQFGGVSNAIQGVTQSLTAMQRATIVLAALAAAAMVINELADKAKGAPPDINELTASLKRLGEAGKFTGELKRTFGDMDQFVKQAQEMRAANDMLEKAKPYTGLMPMGAVIEKLLPKLDSLVNGTKGFTATAERFKAFDEAFANLAKSGHMEEAANQFRGFEQALLKGGYSAEQVAAAFPQYLAAVSSLKAEQELAARSMGLFGEQAVAVKTKLDAQKASADGLRQAIQALNDVNRSTLDGMIGFEAAIDAAAEAAKKNADSLHATGGVLDLNSEKSRAAAQALSDLAAKTDEAAAAARESGGSWDYVNSIYERGRQKLIEAAVQMGLTSRQAAALAEQIQSMPNKTAFLHGNMDDLQAKLNAARAQLATVPDSRRAELRASIGDLEAKVNRARADLNSLDDRTVYIRTIYQKFTEAHPGGQAQAHGGVIGAAAGGPRSRMTLVGEQGPELVDLAPGSRVRSNSDSRRIAEGMGGGGREPIIIEFRSSGNRADDFLLESLRRSVREKGGDVQIVIGGRSR